jgi:adenylate cyclase
MELKALDLQFLSRGLKKPGNEVVLVTIDGKSLDELGRWPWSRRIIAQGLELLARYKAKVIGIDIVFSEPEQDQYASALQYIRKQIRDSGLKEPSLERWLDSRKKESSPDKLLAEATKKAGTVVLGYFFYTSPDPLTDQHANSKKGQALPTGYSFTRFKSRKAKDFPLIKAYSVESPLPALAAAASGVGFFNIFPDQDGSIRSLPLVVKYRDQLYSPFALEIAKLYLKEKNLSVQVADFGIDEIRLGQHPIHSDEQGRLMINYRGHAKTFPHYSFSDLVNQRLSPLLFNDKIVLIGATAIGTFDLRVTPFGNVFPGLEIHANIIDNILRQDFLTRPNWTAILNILAIILIGLILSLALGRIRATWGLALVFSLFLAYFFINRYFFLQLNQWLGIVYPSLNIILLYLGITALNYMTEEREKRRIRGAFQYYVAPSVVNEMLKNPEQLRLGGEKKELTILFSDIRDFTTISEKMEPEVLVRFLNKYLTRMANIIFRHEGLVDKYMGDAIMAIFGAPLPQEDHTLRACLAALDMTQELYQMQKEAETLATLKLAAGIGINTGYMVIGNMGSESRFDYTVLGDNVNLGSRLEGLNKEYGTHIIISEITYEKTKDQLLCRELDLVRVKGKDKPVKIYELLNRLDASYKDHEFVTLFHSALACYRQRSWHQAKNLFQKSLQLTPQDYPSQIYIARCNQFIHTPPPPDWDYTFTFKTK